MENPIIAQALNVIRESSKKKESKITECANAVTFCKLKIANIHQEKFLVLFLDSQHNLIEDEIMFNGTINSASVYPREIIRRSLELGAAAIIISHNHPSGEPAPSMADRNITDRIKKCCDLFDISLLDHIIVTHDKFHSFAQHGLL